MNRDQMNRFSMNPTTVDIQRSRFDRKHSLKFSANVGDIVPIYIDEVLPGDTFQMDTSKVLRMQPMVTPVLDNLYADTYFFFCPARLTWTHWKNFMGENSTDAWIPEVDYTIPQIAAPAGGFAQGSIADYFGLPTKVDNISVSVLPFRAYALICSEWFRDENLMDPVHVYTDDTDRVGLNTRSSDYNNMVSGPELGGAPYKASKYHDYFTSALPSPQKGPDVTFSLADASLPVKIGDTRGFSYDSYFMKGTFQKGVRFVKGSNTIGNDPSSFADDKTFSLDITRQVNESPYSDLIAYRDDSSPGPSTINSPIPANLWADGSDVSMFNVNELRTAFAIQRYYEKLARGGSRYIEMIKAFFGVSSPDSRLQRPEYLGGSRLPINISQVEQTSASEAGLTPQGNVSGMSLTGETHSDFTYSATEHGFIIGVMVMRYNHTYQQGIERFWSRKTNFDFYNPTFANLGEMAIKRKEIYADGSDSDEDAFGYQEAWADYRYKPSHVTGSMRSNSSEGSLDVWHFADYYTYAPSLSPDWIREDKNIIDRSLAVTSQVTNQYFGDIYFDLKVTRPMPLYSIPGLIDHH